MRVRFTGTDLLTGDAHPLKGLVGTLGDRFGMSCAGYDCTVLLPLTTWAKAMVDGTEGFDEAYWTRFAHEQDMVRGDMVAQEANFADELETL